MSGGYYKDAGILIPLSTAVWGLIFLALLGANLPFLNQRLFALIRLGPTTIKKPLWVRLIELVIFYFLIGGMGYLLESRMGNVFPQGWEFYAITVCLFIVLAFPGFVFQYLRTFRG